nr:hypothetical protein [Desulfovibrio inopinatus]
MSSIIAVGQSRSRRKTSHQGAFPYHIADKIWALPSEEGLRTSRKICRQVRIAARRLDMLWGDYRGMAVAELTLGHGDTRAVPAPIVRLLRACWAAWVEAVLVVALEFPPVTFLAVCPTGSAARSCRHLNNYKKENYVFFRCAK